MAESGFGTQSKIGHEGDLTTAFGLLSEKRSQRRQARFYRNRLLGLLRLEGRLFPTHVLEDLMKILALTALVLPMLIAPLAAVAEEPEHASIDLPTKHPAAFRSWQKLLPDNLRQLTWLSLFHGPESPMETLHKGSQPFFLGHVCKTHDCGNNGASFLIAEDGSEAFGLVRSAEASGGMDLFLGDPDEEVKKILLDSFGE